MDEKTTDLKFIEAVVGFLVEHPESIKINRIVDEMGVLLTLDVHPDDMRQVIGREGNTAKAIRTLLRVVGMRSNARVNLKINEPEGAAPRQPRMERPMDRHSNNDRGGYRNDRGSDRGGYNRPRYDRDDRGGSGDDHGYAN
jgi:predicted RNA-binding protein YlqC (UPF0109 family)